ncbi:MAG TPA: DoxX family protein [Actinomycetota bacterium]|nr:DoxX family protein [Actinomycetota bacterium]
MSVGLLLLRLVVGALFVGHGTQKLFGWFGGHGLRGTAGFMESLGFRNGRWAAVAAGLAETVGGLLLACGLLTPLAAAAIVGVMVTAALCVHVRNGVWNANGGVELPLVYATAATALAFAGPGAYSVDSVLGLELSGPWYGLAAVALGFLAALAATAFRRAPVPAAASQPSPTEQVAA